MSRNYHSNKVHQREDYIPCKITCIMCNALNKNRSRIFKSNYALKYHLATEHDIADEIESGITRKEVLNITRAVSVALDWNMLIELPKRSKF